MIVLYFLCNKWICYILQDGFKVGYLFNDTASGNEVSANVTCDTAMEFYCVIPVQGQLPGQMYEIRVHSKLGTAVSRGAGMLHSTGKGSRKDNQGIVLLKHSCKT